MATLYQRLTGVGLVPAEGAGKIGIHSFCGALYELHAGYLTGQNIVSIYSLTGPQTTEATTLKSYIDAAPNKSLFMRVFKNVMYMAESGDAYLSQQELVSRLQAEITDQGGTLP